MSAQVTETKLDAEAIEGFAASIRGPVLQPGDEGYDAARAIWNGLIDRKPAIIVQPTGAADVVDAVNFAREHDLLLSIKGGGHNVAGNAVNDGGIVIDLSQHARRARRSKDGNRPRPGRDDLRRHGPRDATVRSRGSCRRRVDHGRRRPHAARRRWSSAPQARTVDRQPALGRDRHRRRPAAHGERDGERGSVLGRARRREQLRRRDVVRVPGASGRPDGDGRRDLLSAGGREVGPACLARLHGFRAGRVELGGALLERARRRALPAGGARETGRGHRRRRTPDRSRTASRSCSRCGSSESR